MGLLLLLIINGFALVLAGFAFFSLGLRGKLILLVLLIITFFLPFLFRRGPDTFSILLIVTHIARFLVGAGCYTYLKVRGDI